MNKLSNQQQANPFLKIGDIIYLYSRQGKYKVVSIDGDGFSVVPEQSKSNAKLVHCLWDDLKRWSSHS